MDAHGRCLTGLCICTLLCFLRLSAVVSGEADAGGSHVLQVDLFFNSSTFAVWVNRNVVYSINFSAGNGGGTYILGLHEKQGSLVASKRFLTSNPFEAQILRKFLESLHESRTLVVAVIPEGNRYLLEAESTLTKRGCKSASLVAIGEAWACIVNGNKAWEAMITRPALSVERKCSYNDIMAHLGLSLSLSASFESKEGHTCNWHKREDMNLQRVFCDKYDGFPDICQCHQPLQPSVAFLNTDQMEIREVIPCVILTSREPYNFYRLLLQLTQMKGAGQTPFLVQFGGHAPVSEELVKLFNLPFSKAVMTSSNGDLENVTSSIASLTYKSISSAFERFPQAKKVIIIEDDLILSPDFLWYFQQTSALLDEDPTILAVSAHRIQSSGYGRDPTRILRGKAPPQWGWMADRRILKRWVPKYWGDWDYWIMSLERADGIDIIFPELSRSLHAGSSGTHIDGFAQAMIYNLESASVQKSINISNLSELQIDKYRSKMAREITHAVPVSLTGPENCQTPLQLPFDKETPLVMYINDYRERYTIFLCLGGFYQDLREDFDSVHQINVEGWKLFLVECPASPYCFQKPPSYAVVPYNDDFMEALWGLHMFRNSQRVRSAFRLRRQAFSIEEELELRNTEVGYAVIGLDIPTLFLSKAFILPLWSNEVGHEYKTPTHVSDSSLQGNESEKRNEKEGFVGNKNVYKDGSSLIFHNSPKKRIHHTPQNNIVHHTHQNSIYNINISSEKVIHKYGGKSDGNNSKLTEEKRERGSLGKPPTTSLTLLRTLKEQSVQEKDFGNQLTSRMTKESEKLFSAVIQRSTTSPARSDLTYYLTCISASCVAADPLLQINKLPKIHRSTASLVLEEFPVLYDITIEFTVKDYFDNPFVLNGV